MSHESTFYIWHGSVLFTGCETLPCPNYIALDARTNKPLENDVKEQIVPFGSCKIANDTFRRIVERADLSCFDPHRERVGIPSTSHVRALGFARAYLQ